MLWSSNPENAHPWLEERAYNNREKISKFKEIYANKATLTVQFVGSSFTFKSKLSFDHSWTEAFKLTELNSRKLIHSLTIILEAKH